jgi:hypothetical protein
VTRFLPSLLRSPQGKETVPDNSQSVEVLGPHDEYVSHTHPARARKLINQGKACILSTKPFIIKMRGVPERTYVMGTKKFIKPTNFTELFREEKDIWVQNVGKTQISMQFEPSPGRIVSVCIPRTKDPFNLSTRVSWDALRNSTDFKIMINRRPARLIIMSYDEVEAYFKTKAKNNKTSVDEEMAVSFEKQTALMEHTAYVAPEDAEVKTLAQMEREAEESAEEEDAISPRLVGLLNRYDKDLPKEDQISVAELKDELEVMADELTPADWDYIQSLAPKSIKNWAQKLRNPESEVE